MRKPHRLMKISGLTHNSFKIELSSYLVNYFMYYTNTMKLINFIIVKNYNFFMYIGGTIDG